MTIADTDTSWNTSTPRHADVLLLLANTPA